MNELTKSDGFLNQFSSSMAFPEATAINNCEEVALF